MVDEFKDIRWKQRFENFNKSYRLLEKYLMKTEFSELEQAEMRQLLALETHIHFLSNQNKQLTYFSANYHIT